MNDLLNRIFETSTFVNSRGETIHVHSQTSKGQCQFLQQIIKENNFTKSIEIGFAYGISTLAITEQIAVNRGRHVVIDKFQHTYWNGNGLDLLKQTGYMQQVSFIEEFSYIALPGLLQKGQRFDFAYVDTTKLLDWILVDFFYLDKLLEINGVIAFDDVPVPAIRKILRYLAQFPHYKIYGQFPDNWRPSKLYSMFNLIKRFPKSGRFLKSEIIRTDFDLGINTSCVALQKIGEDKRNFDWHVDF